jgi:hypothetical protein
LAAGSNSTKWISDPIPTVRDGRHCLKAAATAKISTPPGRWFAETSEKAFEGSGAIQKCFIKCFSDIDRSATPAWQASLDRLALRL